MKLQARLKLKLKRQNNKIVIQYNTFEKATFDQYLISSIVKHTRSENVVNRYIDQVTGNGSLNAHFKKLYEKIKDMDSSAIDKILNDSMYPVLKIDASNRYTFYPELKISLMNNKLYEGNILDDETLPKSLVPEGEFHDSNIEEDKVIQKSDSYRVILSDDKIEIELMPKIKIQISKELFSNIIDIQVKEITEYRGEIHKNIQGNNWKLMSNSKLNELEKESHNCFYHNGDHFLITNKYAKKTQVSQVFGMYIYNETYYEYNKGNRKYCELVANQLLKSGLINTFKINKLVNILGSLKLADTQNYLNYLLGVKDSKELALLGLRLIDKGLEDNWSDGAVENFVKFMKSDRDLLLAYRVNKKHHFNITQLHRLYNIDKSVMKNEDLELVQKYLKNRESMIEEINKIMGEITMSGRRQSTRELENTSDVKKYRKLSHKLQGHYEKNIINLSQEELEKLHKNVLEYQKLDLEMIRLLEK